MYVLHLSGDTVKILEGSASKKKVVINSLYSIATPSDYLDSPDDKGYEKLESVVINALRELGEEVKNKKVKIILDNINISFREMLVPTLNRQKTIALIKNEIFSDDKLARNNTVDYIVDENKVDGLKQSKVFVTYVDNKILSDMQKMAKTLMCNLVSIDIGQNCTLKHLAYIQDTLPDNYLFVEIRESAIVISFIVDKKFKYSMSKSVISMQSMKFKNDKMYFVNDALNTLRSAIDLYKKRFPENDLRDIVLSGGEEKLELLRKPASEKYGVNVLQLDLPDNVESVGLEEYNDFFCSIGGLMDLSILKV